MLLTFCDLKIICTQNDSLMPYPPFQNLQHSHPIGSHIY